MRYRKIVLLIIGIGVIISPIAAYTQTGMDVERGIREVDRSMRKEAEEKLKSPPKKTPLIEEEKEEEIPEGPTFFVKKIKLLGCETFPPETFSDIVKEYENRDVSLDELRILAKKIERTYLKKGIIAACFIPPQDVKEGIVVLQIVEARMGELEIRGGVFFNKRKIASYWDIEPGEILQYHKISRSLQLINRNPDREVKAALHAGKKRGTTDVLLDAKTYFPVHITASIDREGAASTGKLRPGMGVRHNNFLTLDDTLLTGWAFSDHSDSIYAYHTLPISNFGTMLMCGFSRSESFPKKDLERFDLRSYAKSASFFIHQDIFQKDIYLGEMYFGFDGKDKVVYTNTGVNSKDRLRVLRFGSSVVLRGLGSIINIKPEYSQGINLLGAKRGTELSSRHAGNTFQKVSLGLSQRIILPSNIQLSLKANAQYAPEKLAPQEEFALGGINSVRGYPSGDFYGDNAFQASVELLVPALFLPEELKIPFAKGPLRDDITGVLFFDYGYGDKRGREASEKYKQKLAGVGTGVRIRAFDQALLRLEWAVPIELGDDPISETTNVRFHISLEFEDRLHREFERISNEMKRKRMERVAWGILDEELHRPDSPLRSRLSDYWHTAKTARKKGDLKEAKDYYEKVRNLGTSLYSQTLRYVGNCEKHEGKLEEYAAAATRHYREGRLKQARAMWQKVAEEAKVKPLVLEL